MKPGSARHFDAGQSERCQSGRSALVRPTRTCPAQSIAGHPLSRFHFRILFD